MHRLLAAVAFCLLSSLSHATTPSHTNMIATPEAVQVELAQAHPSTLYMHARKLFEEGRRDEAVVWFYIGQLRFRYHLLANPGLPADGEPAVMDALNATLGQTINEWAGGKPQQWIAAIEQALAWDEAHPNPTTPKARHASELEEIRQGLRGLADYIRTNLDEIAAQRRANGLDNGS
ncbi:hypothetical protein HW090_05235 [Pseudomonas sp. ABC1]|uniref:hypothetical protein n=1 Tax=Pseudomonas sp. ABC1 TaxID=2748080 RepID=UPI0015C2F8B7|nr:hypothetical protein [Pseudomonas sp. ABC1]QLF92624.1 hypothetical protein HW090_05235 [Pseudomonas sp. ABC1]